MAAMLIECACGEAHEIGERNIAGWVRCRCGRIVRAPRLGRGASIATPSARRLVPLAEVAEHSDVAPETRRARAKAGLGVSRAAATRWLVRLSWGYLAAVVIACVVLWTLSERWWPATVFLFGPRWILLLPLAVLVPVAVALRASLLLPLTAAAAIILVPVMGLRLGWRSWLGGDDAGASLRVVTLNTGASQALGLELPFRLDAWRADIVALQECGTILREDVQRIQGWHHHVAGQLCLISRYPIREASVTNWDDLAGAREAGIGGSGQAVQYTIDTPQRPIRFVNLHLETAREGLQGVFDLDFKRVAENRIIRAIESGRTRGWIGTADPSVLIAGDFNMPVESTIYRKYWSEFRNAFSEAGTGFGMTKDNGWIQVRIDHILTGAEWRPRRAVVGPVVGLDHRPVIADLSWGGRESMPAAQRQR